MSLFSKFGSKKDPAEKAYQQGLKHLKSGELKEASVKFSDAMELGHISAQYNLSLLWGAGTVSPYDFDIAADCWYKAAAAGHERAQKTLWLIEAADRGGIGFDNLANMLLEQPAQQIQLGQVMLNGPLMICTARFTDVVCRKFGSTVDVIAYELDRAASSDFPYVHAFLARTGVDSSFYEGGLNRLIENSSADQTTDGLDAFSAALQRSGVPLQLAIMARCSIVGYIIRKSAYGRNAQPLLGTDKFFDAPPTDDKHPKLQRLCDLLADDRCDQFFVAALFSNNVQVPIDLMNKVQEAISLAKEISDLTGISPEKLYESIKSDS